MFIAVNRLLMFVREETCKLACLLAEDDFGRLRAINIALLTERGDLPNCSDRCGCASRRTRVT